MSGTLEKFAETPEPLASIDVVDDALRSLRIGASVLLHESYVAPWAVTIPAANRLSAILRAPRGARVMAFHWVESGQCELSGEGRDKRVLRAGDLVVCFGGHAHRLSLGAGARAATIESLIAKASASPRESHPKITRGVTLICGVFVMHQTMFNPLFAALPTLLHWRAARDDRQHRIAAVAGLIAEEIARVGLGRGYVVERLLEVLCAQAIRARIDDNPARDKDWFRGVRDPVVGRALEAIHGDPARKWSVGDLARLVAMSPSRFAMRFTELLGDSPMAYLAKWRMNVACARLVATTEGVDRIAFEVGYDNVTAFHRAFKKHLGQTPSAWRADASTDAR